MLSLLRKWTKMRTTHFGYNGVLTLKNRRNIYSIVTFWMCKSNKNENRSSELRPFRLAHRSRENIRNMSETLFCFCNIILYISSSDAKSKEDKCPLKFSSPTSLEKYLHFHVRYYNSMRKFHSERAAYLFYTDQLWWWCRRKIKRNFAVIHVRQ